MTRFWNALPFFWLLLALPGLGMAYAYVTGATSYGETIHYTGDWAVWLLIATLAVSPLRLMFNNAGWTMWLARRRRALGVASFAYALFHLVVYLWRKARPDIILDEGVQPDLLTGWIAFVLFLALALTSNDRSLRMLKRNWRKLHMLVYPAAVLVFGHWILTAFEPKTAYIHAAVLAALVAIRVVLVQVKRRRR